jgi:hypothetical protein
MKESTEFTDEVRLRGDDLRNSHALLNPDELNQRRALT